MADMHTSAREHIKVHAFKMRAKMKVVCSLTGQVS